jgi:O-antigen/teichoic acid export membrane protein
MVMASIAQRLQTFTSYRSRGRHRQDGPDLALTSVRELIRESLFRNSAFLLTNVGLVAVFGFCALSLLTRLYPVQAVGLTAAATSAAGLISSVTQFGLTYTLPRFLPSSAHRTALINSVLTATMLAAVLGAALFLALPVASNLYALGGPLFVLIFICATSLNAGDAQLTNVFIADRAAQKVTLSTVVGSVARLAALVIFIPLGMIGAFLAQSATAMVGFVFLAAVLARQGQHFRPTLSRTATRDLRRFSAGAYLGGQIGALPALLLPLIILARFGASQNAYWYTAVAIASLLYQVPGSVARALLPETAHRPAERKSLMRRSAILIAAVMAPVLLIAYFVAPLVLAILGHRYAVGSLAPLRLLILAGVMSSINYVTGTVLYIAKKTFAITVINTVDAVIVLGLAATLARDSTEVAFCWLIGEVVNVAAFTVWAMRSLREVNGHWEALGEQDQAA